MNDFADNGPEAAASVGPARKRSTCACRKRPATSSTTPSSWN